MNTLFVSTTQIQRNFRRVLEKLHTEKRPITILRDSEPAAVLVSYHDYERLVTLEDTLLKQQMKQVLDHLGNLNSSVPVKTLDFDIVAARHATRRR